MLFVECGTENFNIPFSSAVSISTDANSRKISCYLTAPKIPLWTESLGVNLKTQEFLEKQRLPTTVLVTVIHGILIHPTKPGLPNLTWRPLCGTHLLGLVLPSKDNMQWPWKDSMTWMQFTQSRAE